MQDALQATKILAEDCRTKGTAFRLGVNALLELLQFENVTGYLLVLGPFYTFWNMMHIESTILRNRLVPLSFLFLKIGTCVFAHEPRKSVKGREKKSESEEKVKNVEKRVKLT